MNKNLKKKKKGFTLVEVIIVLAIIAIIAAIAIPNLTKVRTESKTKADIQSMESIARTINMLVTDETIPYDGAEATIKIEYTANEQEITAELSATGANNDTVKADLEEYLSGIKKPQVEGQTGYEITITPDGEIGTFTTGKIIMNQNGDTVEDTTVGGEVEEDKE